MPFVRLFWPFQQLSGRGGEKECEIADSAGPFAGDEVGDNFFR